MSSEKDVAVTVTDKTIDQVYQFGKKLGKYVEFTSNESNILYAA